MTSEPSVFAVALAQFHAMKAPTVIVPVVSDGDEGVFYATYQGSVEWMALASAKEHQAEVAIACCKHATPTPTPRVHRSGTLKATDDRLVSEEAVPPGSPGHHGDEARSHAPASSFTEAAARGRPERFHVSGVDEFCDASSPRSGRFRNRRAEAPESASSRRDASGTLSRATARPLGYL